MQGYGYSVFSSVAIAIHLIINFDILVGRGMVTAHGARYRGFLSGILAYYITDAAWGVLAGLGWHGMLYADTILFFLALAAFVIMWCRFVVAYLGLGKWATRLLAWFSYALLALIVGSLAVNPFNECFFHLDALGNYRTGLMRDVTFFFLVSLNAVMALVVLVRAIGSRDSVRRRSLMVFMCCITMAVSLVMQVFWPLTPFTALGCLISNCFLHVFVVQDEQTAKHMAELEKALERARSAEKARSMFFSIVSHDIRTPLNAILGYSELLQDGVKTKAERQEALNSIRSSGTTLLQLVNDVLDLAKMDSGQMTLQPEPVLMSKLTDEVFSSFWMVASGKGVELVNRTDRVPTLILDGHRFRQILFNLVGNAVKFTQRGSVTVSATYFDSNLEVSVSDTGCGIAPDMLTRVFDPFVQAQDPSHSADRAGGTGLGLSICRRLVEMMGGELVVESELGKGSTFKARIPGVDTKCDRRDPAGEENPAPLLENLPKRVLVVDDSPVNRLVVTAFLKKAGITSIDHAGDGGEALSKLESARKSDRPYDFVFSDFWMPNMNGLEFIERLRSNSRFDGLRVFAVTADTEYRGDSRYKLFSGVLLKPLTYAKLVEAFASS